MSTKIYNGYRRRTSSIADLTGFLAEFRAAARFLAERLIVDAVARRCAFAIDCDRLDGKPAKAPLFGAFNEIQDAYAQTRLPGGRAKLPIVGGSGRAYVSLTAHRDPENDFACDLVVLPGRRWTHFLIYAEQTAFTKLWEGMNGVEAYGYWNNTDRPDEVAAREWTRRAKIWDELIGHDAPARRGLGLEIPGDTLFFPEAKDVLAHLPTRTARIEALARRKGHESAPKIATADEIGKVFDWLGSPECKAAIAAARQEIEPIFKDEITLHDLAGFAAP